MTPLRKPSRDRLDALRLLTAAGAVLVAAVWAAGDLVGERHWTTTLLAYVPQHPFLVPSALLLLASLARRRVWLALANIVVLAFGAFQLLGLSLAPQDTGTRPSLRVMTYNIHHGSLGIEAVARDIRRQNPDVVLLQECNAFRSWPDPMPRLAQLLPGYRTYLAGDEVAMLCRLPVRSVAAWPLRDSGPRRIALSAVLSVGGRSLRVLNVHLMTSSTGSSLARSGRRAPDHLRQTARVRGEQLERVRQWVQSGDGPCIVAGDFNTPPRGVFYRRMPARGLSDSFRQAGRGFGATYPSDIPLLRIDHIFTGKGVRALRTWVPRTHGSDHRPVVADLLLE